MNSPFFQKKQLAAAILVFAPVFGAQAALVQLDLSATSTSSIDSNPILLDSAGPSPANVFTSSSQFGTSYASGSANGYTDGSFYSDANGYGLFDSSATFLQSYTVTNDPFDQLFDFNFFIENGSLNAGCDQGYGSDGYGSDGYGSDGYGSGGCGPSSASYEAEIRLNGSAIWNSMAELIFDGTDTIFNATGQMLGTYFSSNNYYDWGDQSYTLDLGSYSEGEVFTLDYEVTVTAFGNDGSARAQFGDPNGFGQGGSPFTTTPTSVPEPGSLGIIAAGLGLLGLSRRRKNRTQH